MESLRRLAGAVDDWIFRIERLLLLVAVGAMTVLVSLDVAQRTFSRTEGRTASLLIALLGEGSRARVLAVYEPLVFGAASLAFFMLAAHAARVIRAERAGAPAPGFAVSAARGLGVWAALGGAVKALLHFFPSSLPGAQKFALAFMLWAAMLGASLATRSRRHIALDVVSKGLDPAAARVYGLAGGLVTAAFCGLLGYLGVLQLRDEYLAWDPANGVGVYDALPVPKWVGTLSVPVAFVVMALRFAGLAVRDFVFGAPVGGVDAHGVDLEALAKAELEQAEAGQGAA